MIALTIIADAARGFHCETEAPYALLGTWLEREVGRGGTGVEVDLFEEIGKVLSGAKARVVLAGNEHLLVLERGVAGIAQLAAGAVSLELPFAELEDAVVRWFRVVDPEIAAQLLAVKSRVPNGGTRAPTRSGPPRSAHAPDLEPAGPRSERRAGIARGGPAAAPGEAWRGAWEACRAAILALRDGDKVAAGEQVEVSWRLVRGAPPTAAEGASAVYRRLCFAFEALGDAERALESARQCVELEREVSRPLLLANDLMTLARLLSAHGSAGSALQVAHEGCALIRARYGPDSARSVLAARTFQEYVERLRRAGS